ncbi:hypothetical protein SELMODRAFT_407701 [Selaginella moellendorffii]|uniref:Uncharacterized protein n=1 Tax=Selaginella moellendorffii TaxID=88036 RepID=D8R6H3_SELML|nr:hypothetical protein SELMODRAFT_407701 [Selaginella moellendorffii]
MGIHQVIGFRRHFLALTPCFSALLFGMFFGSRCGSVGSGFDLLLNCLLEDVEEDEVDGLPSNFSDSDYGSSMDSDNDALPEAFYNFLQSRGFGSPAAFGTWMHLKILETKTTAYLACYLRISKPTLYKYMRLVDPNWRGVYYRVPPEEAIRRFGRPKRIRSDNAPKHNEVERDMIRCWGPVARSFIRGTSTRNQEFSMYPIHATTKVYVVSLLRTSRRIFHTGLQPGTSMRIMPAVGGKDIEDLPGPFLSNVEGATLSEALGTVRNQAFFMHREGLNLDEQYLLHLDLTMECAMADVAGVDLSLLEARTPHVHSSRHYGNTSRARSQALDVPQSVQPIVLRDTCQPLDFPSSVAGTSTPTASHPQLPTAFEQAERRLTLHTLQHMQNLQHVLFSSPSLESSSPSIRNEQVWTPHAHGVVQSGTLPPTPTPTRGRAHGIPYSATTTSPATPPTATTLATPSTGTSASTWPSTS